jgi:hypothetical protein
MARPLKDLPDAQSATAAQKSTKKDRPFNKLVLANPWGKAILRLEVVRERRAQALISLLHLPICPFAHLPNLP